MQFQGAFYRPLEPSQNMFRGGRQVSQVGQAPSGPTVIRLLATRQRKSLMISLSASIQYTVVTDRQTDTRQQLVPRLRLAWRSNNQ